MYIKFKKLSFSNLMSYGASGAEINFRTGLNTIKAVNGSGKSSILDALTFVLFGKPYRDIKLSELVNTTNGKAMEVAVDFDIGSDAYTIKRGLKPAMFEIYKNGQELNMLSSKKLNQDEIDKLLGINLRLFKNIVAVAVTNNKPFLSMSIGDKRVLIENIFNIDVLGQMCKDVKKRKTIAATEFGLKQTELTGVTRSINDNKNYLENMKNYIASFNEIKDTNINRINGNIETYRGRIDKCVKNIELAQKKIEELEQSLGEAPDVEKGNQMNQEIGKLCSTVERIQTTLDKLKQSRTCPICSSPLDEGHARKHIEAMLSEKKEIEKVTLPALRKKYEDFCSVQRKYGESKDFIRTIENKSKLEENTKQRLEQELVDLEESLVKEQNKTCPADLTGYTEKLAALTEQSGVLEKELSELEDTINLNTELISILGDDGIKTYFFKKLTAILNKSVNEYIQKFELKNTEITFNDQMEETMITNMVPRTYMSYSSGERTRIDMSILLSFFDISRLISNWSCNLLFIDELFDSGVDASGIACFVNTLKGMTKDKGHKLCIYIISHKIGDLYIELSSSINIKKEHDYSILTVTEYK